MPSITIRNVPEETRNELAARAASSGRSMQEYLLATLIDMTSKPSPEVLMARIRARKAANPNTVTADDIVRDLREMRGPLG